MTKKRSVWAKWIELCADVCWEKYGGTWGRKAPDGSWYVIRFENMSDHLPDHELEDSGIDLYEASLVRVDLADVPASELEGALDFCAPDDIGDHDAETQELMTVWALVSYGAAQPLGAHTDPSYPSRAMASARRHAEALIADSEKLQEQLERPVNAIGTTALEYARGDITSALERGCLEGAPKARLMAKMYGVDQESIDDARPRDVLPYLIGYIAGKRGDEPTSDPEVAEEYHQGHRRGERVRKGVAPAPSWIREGGAG